MHFLGFNQAKQSELAHSECETHAVDTTKARVGIGRPPSHLGLSWCVAFSREAAPELGPFIILPLQVLGVQPISRSASGPDLP